ncbi:MAG: 3-hydroxyacyl-CoA dehydrogenase NAD-binding domain-containing protein [Gammaproteobacteria bacterium]|nr:3-hydroxyacyl-CoA dehydrogenase NAD-binding domain-containing protein [Gammaproteobacteria bacterium]
MNLSQDHSREPVQLLKHGPIAEICIDNPPVNALSQPVRQGLLTCLTAAEKDHEIQAVIITCNGRTFIAGADISEFGKLLLEPHLPDVLDQLDRCTKPIVAALFGTVLGGGFEVALSCHYRVALPQTKLGLPEVTLGLIPGAGGTQLLPRLAGAEMALEMITSGKPQTALQLFDHGVIDVLLEQGSLSVTKQAIEFALQIVKAGKGARRVSQMIIDTASCPNDLFDQWRTKLAKKARGQKAPQYCINAIENALLVPFEEGKKREREMFIKCLESSQSRAMRHAFFAERSAAKLPPAYNHLEHADLLPIQQVAVIGAGTMGGGIAICFANAGISVQLLEMSEDNLARGLAAIRTRFEQALKRGLITQQQLDKRMSLIVGTCNYEDLNTVDLVVEAAFETIAVKQQIFSTLDRVCKAEAILATNTSYLDINKIAKSTSRTHKVIGMHFFSPANIMKLLEVVYAADTDEQSVKTVMALGKKLGKVSVAVGVCYGFVGNRMYACYGREANMLLLEGASPQQIDTAMKNWGMAMGPLAVNDMSGIDIGYKARQENPPVTPDPLYFRAADLMVEAGRLGQKTAAGFYRYDTQTKKLQVDDAVLPMFAEEALKLGVIQRDDISEQEIQHRLIFSLINEGATILSEGIATRASDIDAIWLNGYGFPRHLGGPMCYADEIGLDKVVAGIKTYQQQGNGLYWQTAPLLETLLLSGGKLAQQ